MCFYMIDKNIKLEEYRDIKPYWEKRFKKYIEFGKPFLIIFKNGYSRTSPIIKRVCAGIKIGEPRFGWADKDTDCFILELYPGYVDMTDLKEVRLWEQT